MFNKLVFLYIGIYAILTIVLIKITGLIAKLSILKHYRYFPLINLLILLLFAINTVLFIYGYLLPTELTTDIIAVLAAIVWNLTFWHHFKRFGNPKLYITLAYVVILYTTVIILFSNTLGGLSALWSLNPAIKLIFSLFILNALWLALWIEYRSLAFLMPLIASTALVILQYFSGTSLELLLPLTYLLGIAIYIYTEFVHPYPTLFDKYIFNRPVHLMWKGILLTLTLLIVLL